MHATGIKLLNTMRQVITQQAVFITYITHFDLEQKSKTTHYDTYGYQICDNLKGS